MSTPLRDRVEHAARYGANLVVPAREVQKLIDERDQFVLHAGRQLDRANDAHSALDRISALHPTTGDCPTCTRGRLYPIPAPCPTAEAAALAEGSDL